MGEADLATQSSEFRIEVLEQHWLGEPENQTHDLCSHGALRVTIGGEVVTSSSADYGIAQSALALLRTLDRDHTPADSVLGSGYLLCHGCGFPYIFGCGNFGTSWSVHHQDEGVRLAGFEHHDVDERGRGRTQTFPMAEVIVARRDYTREVVTFAEEARSFHASAGERIFDIADEREFVEAFWSEFNLRLARASADRAR